MTNPDPLDCGWPLAARFTTVTTAGRRSRTTSTVVSDPGGTTTADAVGIDAGAGVTSTSSLGARPVITVAVAPPTTPPRTMPTSRSAAALGPEARVGAGYVFIRWRLYLRGRPAVSRPGVASAFRRRAVCRMTSGSTI